MFTRAVLSCLYLLLALAEQTSAYAIPSRSLVARHHVGLILVCDADSASVSAASILDVQIPCPTPSNAGDAMECTGVAVAPGTAVDTTQSQIACSVPTGVGAAFTCTNSFATAAGTAAELRHPAHRG
ncbi:hypothetical protein C8F01DRAFT_1086514 [Mycena amicta]|nr:hypothetical protein C8F01DRAFT_1086514 [Mycena amicta]